MGADEVEKTASSSFQSPEAKKVSSGLQKIASYPYRESTYDAVCGIMKIAADMLDVAADSYETSQGRVESLEKVSSIRVLMDDMIDGGFVDRGDVQEKVAELSGKTPSELAIVKEAIKLAGYNSISSLFESEKTASLVTPEKAGMFDGVI